MSPQWTTSSVNHGTCCPMCFHRCPTYVINSHWLNIFVMSMTIHTFTWINILADQQNLLHQFMGRDVGQQRVGFQKCYCSVVHMVSAWFVAGIQPRDMCTSTYTLCIQNNLFLLSLPHGLLAHQKQFETISLYILAMELPWCAVVQHT